MRTSDLNYNYPPHLVATEPRADYRIMWSSAAQAMPAEISKNQLFQMFQPGDVLAVNDTRVLRRRVTALNGLEILFLGVLNSDAQLWEVLFPAREVRDDEVFMLPGGIEAQLVSRGLPQALRVSRPLTENYFQEFGELALPPYIQKARNERHNRTQEEAWYQTAWAKNPGSYAAPTASLHFTEADLTHLKNERGVKIAYFTLHVGLGTFLPVKTQQLSDHKMHAEMVYLSNESVQTLTSAQQLNKKIWALGTTAARTLESWARDMLHKDSDGAFSGPTDLFIQPGFEYRVVDNLLTNFHQPQSTLIVLVSAFATLPKVLSAYEWAIQKEFRLFSYGDLTVWTK